MPSLGLGLMLDDGASFSPGDVFIGGIVGGWYDPSDLSTLFQDSAGTTPVTADSDPVGMMRDKSGNGNHLVQATAASRPLYKTDGTKHWLEGDGTDDFLRCAFTITQPWERISALRQITWTNNDRILGGAAVDIGILYQVTAPPNIAMYSGSILDIDDAVVDTDFIVTERHSGNNSRGAINNGAYVTGAAGSTAPQGLTLFCSTDSAVKANARCYGLVMRAGTMSDDQIAQVRSYLALKAGVTL